MWVSKKHQEFIEKVFEQYRQEIAELKAKLAALEEHHKKQEDERAQDMAEIARKEEQLKMAQAMARQGMMPEKMPAWAEKVDWNRVETGEVVVPAAAKTSEAV